MCVSPVERRQTLNRGRCRREAQAPERSERCPELLTPASKRKRGVSAALLNGRNVTKLRACACSEKAMKDHVVCQTRSVRLWARGVKIVLLI